MEVAQIADGIICCLNSQEDFLRENPIDPDLVQTACLAHDLGHPPFGHNGERALNRCVADYGGFEGNAQTLRIVGRLARKELSDDSEVPFSDDGSDRRLGLDLTFRSMAALLKYDRAIPSSAPEKEPEKGYYDQDAELVAQIKHKVLDGRRDVENFKVIECMVMDIADDIAYSTYDVEDAFKGRFLSPIDMLTADESLLQDVSEKVEAALQKEFGAEEEFGPDDVLMTLTDIFENELFALGEDVEESEYKTFQTYKESRNICDVGYNRTRFTSGVVKSA
jgi:dGTPase